MTTAGPPRASVSVVIPAFDAEEWISDALASVAGQRLDRSRFDVVVVDDGSSDHTAAIATGMIAHLGLDGTVIRNPANLGVGATRNVGWRAARGDWVQFLDADDQLAPAKLQRQLRAAGTASVRCGVIYSAWQRLRQDGGSWVPFTEVEDPHFTDPIGGIVEDLSFGYLGPCLFRRTALDDVGGLDESKSLAEDLDMVLRLAFAGWEFLCAPSDVPLYLYRQVPGSLWQRARRDPDALRGKHQTESTAEDRLRAAYGDSLPRQTREALAERYTLTYQFAHRLDRELTGDVIDRIDHLALRRAPAHAPRMTHALARVVGLGNALRVHAAVRRVVRSATARD